MACRISTLPAVIGLLGMASLARAQEMPNPQAMQLQIQQIMQQRPREAEAAARAFLLNFARDRAGMLDTLKAEMEKYWAEVAQLTVQFEVFQNLHRRDSVRATLVGRMFGLEVHARALQREYRNALEARRNQIRPRLDSLINRHFDLEDELRALEIADIERRLAEVRAESQRRRDKRAEFVRWAVDDIVRDALRPQ